MTPEQLQTHFNTQFPVGSTVEYREATFGAYKPYRVTRAAWIQSNNVLCMLEGKRAPVGCSPEAIRYE